MLNPIKIGNLSLPHNIVLAPMSGVTDLPFRRLVRKFGPGLVVSEMVASRAMIVEHRKSRQRSAIVEDDPISCVQLAGCEPDVIAEAAKLNEDLGAKIIDLNFGCPAKKVTNGYSGSALMRDELLAAKIFEATVKAVNIPVTVKMRTGWDDNARNAPVLAKLAEDAGIRMITVHGRTRSQFYSGKSDWSFIRQVKEAVNIPVVANGDIVSFETAEECLEQSGADGLMIGRGSYGKPWFVSHLAHYLQTGERLALPTPLEQKEMLLEHYEAMLEYYGLDVGIPISRKHIGWYSAGLPKSSDFRASINTSSDVNLIKAKIVEFYDNVTQSLNQAH